MDLRTACKEAAGWPHDVKVAVNVSPVQFKEQTLGLPSPPRLRPRACGGPARNRDHRGGLDADDETTLTTLRQLRDMGVRIVMDDLVPATRR